MLCGSLRHPGSWGRGPGLQEKTPHLAELRDPERVGQESSAVGGVPLSCRQTSESPGSFCWWSTYVFNVLTEPLSGRCPSVWGVTSPGRQTVSVSPSARSPRILRARPPACGSRGAAAPPAPLPSSRSHAPVPSDWRGAQVRGQATGPTEPGPLRVLGLLPGPPGLRGHAFRQQVPGFSAGGGHWGAPR